MKFPILLTDIFPILPLKPVTPRRALSLVLAAALLGFVYHYRGLLRGYEILTHDSLIWYGAYYYFVDSLLNWNLPLWDPYGQSGNAFYGAIALLGLLDPLVFLNVILVKLTGWSILYSYIYLHIGRTVVMTAGAYFLFSYVSGSKSAARIGAAVFFFAFFSATLKQNGFVNPFIYTPFATYFLLRYLEGLGEKGNARNLYIAVFLLGITLNIYVPAYTAAYLILFFLFSAFSGALRLDLIKIKFADHRITIRALVAELGLGLLFFSGFAVLPFSIFLMDLGSAGEFYPLLRAYDSAQKLLPAMVSEAGVGALDSTQYLGDRVYGTFYNLVQLIAPRYWELRAYLGLTKHIQETFQFVGIMSLVIIVAFLGCKSRFRNAAILITIVTIFLMNSEYNAGPLTPWHQLLISVLPFLKLIKVFESFLGLHLLNLGMLLAISIAAAQQRPKLRLAFSGFSTPLLFLLVGLVVLALSRVLLLQENPGVDSKTLNYIHSLAAIHLSLVVAAWFIISRFMRNHLGFALVGLVALVFAELYYYNLPGQIHRYVLMPNTFSASDSVVHRAKPDRFDDYRGLLTPGYGQLSNFHEAMMKEAHLLPCLCHPWPGALFVGKSYYELITHVPPSVVFDSGGVTAPRVRFFEQASFSSSKKEILASMKSAAPADLRDEIVLIEADPARRPRGDNSPNPELRPRQTPPEPVVFNDFKTAFSPLEKWMQTPHPSLAYIRNLAFSINRAVFEVKNPASGYFYYADGWSRYWRASVNGEQVPLYKANHNYKAVYLEAGRNEVIFEFRPVHFIYSFYLYMVAQAVGLWLLAMHVFPWIRNRLTGAELLRIDAI